MGNRCVFGFIIFRCRYYWNESPVQDELGRLISNLSASPIPLSLISQYLPEEYKAIRSGPIQPVPHQIIAEHIRQVLRVYAASCAIQAV